MLSLFSSIFSTFDNRGDVTKNCTFKTDTNFAALSTDGKAPIMKERFNKATNCFENSVFRRNNISQGILFGPEALLQLREDIMLAIFYQWVAEVLHYYFHLQDSSKNAYVNIQCFLS